MAVHWQRVIYFNIKCLNLIAILPRNGYKLDFYTVYAGFVFVSIALFLVFQGIFLSQDHEFNETVEVVLYVSTVFGGYAKMGVFALNSRQARSFLKLMNSSLSQGKNTQLLELWQKLYCVLFGGACLAGAIIILLPILSGSYHNFTFPLPMWCPFGCQRPLEYGVIYAVLIVVLSIVVVAVYNMDMFFAAVMVLIGVQCELLARNLETLSPNTGFHVQLAACIKHHQEILGFARDFNSFSNLPFLLQFLLSMVNVAMTLFQTAFAWQGSVQFISRFGVAVILIMQMFTYCFFGNTVLAKIMKTAWSYFMILQQLSHEKFK